MVSTSKGNNNKKRGRSKKKIQKLNKVCSSVREEVQNWSIFRRKPQGLNREDASDHTNVTFLLVPH